MLGFRAYSIFRPFCTSHRCLANAKTTVSTKLMGLCDADFNENAQDMIICISEKAEALYRDVLGAEVSEKQDLPEHGVSTVFINLPNTKLELLHPLGENSPIEGFLEKNKSGGLHHICIEVKDIHAAVKTLKENGVRTLSKEPKIGAHNKPVIFCHPKDCNGILLELEEE